MSSILPLDCLGNVFIRHLKIVLDDLKFYKPQDNLLDIMTSDEILTAVDAILDLGRAVNVFVDKRLQNPTFHSCWSNEWHSVQKHYTHFKTVTSKLNFDPKFKWRLDYIDNIVYCLRN